MKITTVGLDLAKNIFHVVCFNEHAKEVKKTDASAQPGTSVFCTTSALSGRYGSLRQFSLLGPRVRCLGA